ncbi:MAG: geranylgeranyl reductase family protein [Armatimonadota bacterium]|nr:geranylgeranyl reductase family protein [Armatimonadota bacterium]MDW8143040.1 geranylgeranyl reductase family protein [Armatimonadota bacterium]
MTRYDADVVVVGSGPAGATAARLLAGWGISVLLIEKLRLPRYKPCGGAITKRTIQLLAPLDISPVVETWVHKLTVQSPDGDSFTVDLPDQLIATVMRDKFDTYLADAAIVAGAKLKTQEQVLRCEQINEGMEIVTTKQTYRSLLLIGADGANSVVAQQLGLKPKRRAFSLVAELATEAKERWDGNIHLYFPIAFNGYAWCFPKGKHLSAGLYTHLRFVPGWRDWLYRYLASFELHDCLDWRKVKGHIIPIADKNSSFHRGNAIVAGDAAGVADPFTGEGISWAIYTGRMAAAFARAFLEGERDALVDYTRAVHEEVLGEMKAAHWFARILFTFPQFCCQHFLCREPVLRNFARLLGGEVSYRQLWQKALRKGLLLFMNS